MTKPTARELLDWIHEVHLKTGCTCQKTGSLPCDAYRLASRVEKVLAECEDVARMEKGHGNDHPVIFIERLMRLLNGEEYGMPPDYGGRHHAEIHREKP